MSHVMKILDNLSVDLSKKSKDQPKDKPLDIKRSLGINPIIKPKVKVFTK